MPAISCNGAPVLSGSISVPYVGAWSAYLDLPASVEVGDRAVISDGVVSWLGTVTRAVSAAGRCGCSVIGGRGNIGASVGPSHMLSATVGTALGGLLLASGEGQAVNISPAVLASPLGPWTRSAGKLGAALSDISRAAGVSWRISSEGMVWLGTGSARLLPAMGTPLVLDVDGASGTIDLAPDGLHVVPGDILSGSEVRLVEYYIGKEFRATAWI